MRARVLLFAAMAVLAADVVVLATGTADDGGAEIAATGTTTLAPAGPAATVDPNAATTTPSTGTDSTAPPSVDETTTTAAGGGASAPPAGPATRTMPLPGRYAQSVSGTANGQQVPSQASFTIEQVDETDQRQVTDTPQGPMVQVLRYTPSEVLLVSLELPGIGRFAPNPAVRYAPVPGAVGETWTWEITSTDGRSTLAQSSAITRTEQVVIAGETVDTVVGETTLTFNSPGLSGTIQLHSWVSPLYVIAVRTRQVANASYYGIPAFASDTTAELVSLSPA